MLRSPSWRTVPCTARTRRSWPSTWTGRGSFTSATMNRLGINPPPGYLQTGWIYRLHRMQLKVETLDEVVDLPLRDDERRTQKDRRADIVGRDPNPAGGEPPPTIARRRPRRGANNHTSLVLVDRSKWFVAISLAKINIPPCARSP